MNRTVRFVCFAMSFLAGMISLGGCGGGSSVTTGYGSIRGVVYDQPVETRGESNDAGPFRCGIKIPG